MDNFTVFVSHRHKDKALANVISHALQDWGISTSNILQASHPETGFTSGSDITDEVTKKAREADLFVLIYSQPNEDWWWCSFELGIATSSDTKPTSVVVFHIGERLPKVVGGSIQINLKSLDDVFHFTRDFHRKPEFRIPDAATRAASSDQFHSLDDASDETIRRRAEALFVELDEHALETHEQDIHRWNYMLMSLNSETVKEIRDSKEKRNNMLDLYLERLLQEIEIRRGSQDSALKKFGYQDFEEGIRLEKLVDRWANSYEEEYENSPVSRNWIDDLCSDIIRAIRNIPATRTFNYFRSVSEHDKNFYRPAVIKVRKLIDRSMEFDVYLYRVDKAEMKAIQHALD